MKTHLALCNIFGQDGAAAAAFAREHGFSGIDWTIDPELPEQRFLSEINHLADFEVRYHCRFFQHEIALPGSAGIHALAFYKVVLRRIQAAGARFMTLHIGLGQPANSGLDLTCAAHNLRELVDAGRRAGVTVCLENLAGGWTSNPRIFNYLIRNSGAGITVDFGHALAAEPGGGPEAFREFVSAFPERVANSHIYHREVPGSGHTPPNVLDDILERLHLLKTETDCRWWTIELHEPNDILHTRRIIVDYLNRSSSPKNFSGKSRPPTGFIKKTAALDDAASTPHL